MSLSTLTLVHWTVGISIPCQLNRIKLLEFRRLIKKRLYIIYKLPMYWNKHTCLESLKLGSWKADCMYFSNQKDPSCQENKTSQAWFLVHFSHFYCIKRPSPLACLKSAAQTCICTHYSWCLQPSELSWNQPWKCNATIHSSFQVFTQCHISECRTCYLSCINFNDSGGFFTSTGDSSSWGEEKIFP